MNLPLSFLDKWQCKKICTGENGPLEELEPFHLKALRSTLTYVKHNSPFYRKHLKDIRVEKIASIDQFREIPFTFPQQIQENSLRFLSVSQDAISRIVTLNTSGTTGISKRICFTRSDLEKSIEFFSLVMSQLTNPMERVLIFLPGNTPDSAGSLLKSAMERINVKGIIHGLITNFNEALNTILANTPSAIIGMPVQLLVLGELLKKKRIKTKSLRNVILTSDYASPALKERISQTMDCEVFDHYGMTETAFGGAIECSAHHGYHLRETDLFFEIIDPKTEEICSPGQWGEITVTTLTREGMPLVRYRTGDISRFIDDPCPCRSKFRRMDYIRYRYPHAIPLPDSQLFGMADLDDLFFTIPGVVDFDASMVTRQGIPCLEIVLKFINRASILNMEIYLARGTGIRNFLYNSPNLQKLLAAKMVIFKSIETDLFRFVDTYSGKRRINGCAKY